MKQRKEIDAHIAWANAHPGAQWHVRQIWDSANGWRIEWEVEGAKIQLSPIAARQLSRAASKNLFARGNAGLSSEQRFIVESWFSDMDRLAKECLARTRKKMVPAEAAA